MTMAELLETAILSYDLDVPPDSTSHQEVYSPITGIIKKITICFPSASNFCLGGKFVLKTVTIVPTSTRGSAEYIRLDNLAEQIYPEVPIKKGDILALYGINELTGDDDLRTITAIVHIQKQE
jgi:hypothetical protein